MDINIIKYNNQKIRKLILEYTSSHKGETQKTVADKIGVALTTLFYHNPTIDTLCKAANFFQRDINYFIDIPNDILINGAKNSLASNPDNQYDMMNKGEKEEINRKMKGLESNIVSMQDDMEELKRMKEEIVELKKVLEKLINKKQ